MTELMKGNLYRMKRDRTFWVCTVAVGVIAFALTCMGARQCRTMATAGYEGGDIAGGFFQLLMVVELFLGVFTGLYLGTDHSDGALRNRLMVGHNRSTVYLAGLGAAMTGTLALTAAWLAGGGLVLLLNRDLWKMGAGQAATFLLTALLSALALASLLTALGMLTEKKASGAVGAILLIVGLLVVSTWLYSRLQEPEMESGIIITSAGMQWADPTPNPRYVGGALREVITFLVNLLPTGPAVQLMDGKLAQPGLAMALAAAVTACSTAIGVFLFGQKDLK